jgi:hypothetical protein
LIGSAFLTTRLAYALTRVVACKLGLVHPSMHAVTFPPTGFDRVNQLMKIPVAITLLISSFASLVISAVSTIRMRNRTDSLPLSKSSGH